jgi:putative SbcD/Mre11-related phosphoesterase
METIFDDRAVVLRSGADTAIVLSDLHLGYEAELSERTGTQFPPQGQRLAERILSLAEKYSSSRLYIVGDLKHSIGVDRSYNWQEIPQFIGTLLETLEVTIIPGNHDGLLQPLLPRAVHLADVHGMTLAFSDEEVGLLHGHSWPTAEVLASRLVIIGHNHPSVQRIKDASSPHIGRPDRIRSSMNLPVFLRSVLDKDCVRRNLGQLPDSGDSTGTLLGIPSFNDLITGVQLNRPGAQLQDVFFENNCFDLSTSEVFSKDGVFLGTVELLQGKSTRTGAQRND